MSVFFYLKICFKKDAFRQIQNCDVCVAIVTYISDTAPFLSSICGIYMSVILTLKIVLIDTFAEET